MGNSDEKRFENRLHAQLTAAKDAPEILARIPIHNPSVPKVKDGPSPEPARTLAELFGTIRQYEIHKDTSAWFKGSDLLVDVSGGMKPDIVVYTKSPKGKCHNRIIIEVKDGSEIQYEKAASQVIRYFLHLLATTLRKPDYPDVRRAVLLAAPAKWFQQPKTAAKWDYFRERYADLAGVFDVTIGEIHMEDVKEAGEPMRKGA